MIKNDTAEDVDSLRLKMENRLSQLERMLVSCDSRDVAMITHKISILEQALYPEESISTPIQKQVETAISENFKKNNEANFNK